MFKLIKYISQAQEKYLKRRFDRDLILEKIGEHISAVERFYIRGPQPFEQ